MYEHTASAQSMPYCHNWASYTKSQREQITRKALETLDVDTLVDLTDHNLTLFGRGGALTSDHTRRSYRTGVRAYLTYALPLEPSG